MPLSSLSTDPYSPWNGRFKERRAAPHNTAPLASGDDPGRSSDRFEGEPGNSSAPAAEPASRSENFSYLYRPRADLLGLMADAPGLGATGQTAAGPAGSKDPLAPRSLDALSWLYLSFPDDAANAAPPKVAPVWPSYGLPRASLRAANAAYESSLDFA